MLAKVLSATLAGVDARMVQVEVDLAQGLPSFATVGLAEGAVREAKDRVRAAIKNSGYSFPLGRITVNLAPAAVRKEGTGYDLPMALGILAAAGALDEGALAGIMICGELSLDGELRPVPGVLPMTLAARDFGCRQVLTPAENVREASLVDGVHAFGVRRLQEAVDFLAGQIQLAPERTDIRAVFSEQRQAEPDFSEVHGQEAVKRAFEIAAAGGHNLLVCGVPGAGKTMMARRLPSILPALTLEEAYETSRIYSCAGLLPAESPLITVRPFRSPHHTVSDAGLIGGGRVPRPGEVSLAHNGVLFLDELPEFRKQVLEVLRQPLEDGAVTIARAASSLRFPARFMLVAAMNPCPCGYLGDPARPCTCPPQAVQRYRSRLSGPLLDRIDLHIEAPPVPVQELLNRPAGEPSASIRARVQAARLLQAERFRKEANLYCNAQMGAREVRQYCTLDAASHALLRQAVSRLGLSARAFHRIVKIARTIADLEAAPSLRESHVAEAVQYRRLALAGSGP